MSNRIVPAIFPKGRTAEVFYKQGQISAAMGNTRSPGNEYRMPSFGMGTSWQSLAFARGFRDKCQELGHKVIGWTE